LKCAPKKISWAFAQKNLLWEASPTPISCTTATDSAVANRYRGRLSGLADFLGEAFTAITSPPAFFPFFPRSNQKNQTPFDSPRRRRLTRQNTAPRQHQARHATAE
jgi:hypothetical protein